MHNSSNTPSVYTILFTEKCSLRCIFCSMYAEPTYMGGQSVTREELMMIVGNIVANHKKTKKNPIRILFTGGEPLLYWDWIREIIEKYGTSIQYAFNTSGYDLTPEILTFLSSYDVYFTLSVCGDEQISKWQRPTANGKYDYWERVSKIFPMLLYYFPNTAWKSILSRRMIPHIHRLWLAAEQMGFREIEFVPDFGDQERAYLRKDGSCEIKRLNEAWQEEDYKKLRDQYSLIARDFAIGVAGGKIRTLEREMKNVLFSLFSNIPLELACGVAAGRGGYTIYAEGYSPSCLTSTAEALNTTVEDILFTLAPPKKCPREEGCPYWKSCIRNGCIKDNFDEQGDFFIKAELSCQLTKAAGDAVVNMLEFLNELNPPFYAEFVSYLKGGWFPWQQHIHIA